MMPLSSLIAINVPPKRDGRSIKRIELVLIANAIARVVELAMGTSVWLALRGEIAALWRYVLFNIYTLIYKFYNCNS